MPLSSKTTKTGISYIDSLLGSTKWANTTLTYSFIMREADRGYDYNYPFHRGLTATEQNAVRQIYSSISEFTNLKFNEVATGGTLQLGFTSSTRTNAAWALMPGEREYNGDVWLNAARSPFNLAETKLQPGQRGYQLLIHEIGHSLGLKHPFDGSVIATDSERYLDFTIMDYYGYGTAVNPKFSAFTTPQTYSRGDIAALQALYGANFNTNSQDTVYTVYADGSMTLKNGDNAPITLTDGTSPLYRTIWDGNGIDTYDFSRLSHNQTIDLRPGEGSTILPDHLLVLNSSTGRMSKNIYNAFQYNGDPRSLIENVNAGSGHDTITGNDADNIIMGGGGDDTIYGGKGYDTLHGGTGNDKLYAGTSDGQKTEFLYGDEGDDYLHGGTGKFQLWGGTGNDYLDGSQGKQGSFYGGEGADTMIGSSGIDTLQYNYSKQGVTVSLLTGQASGGDAAGDVFKGMENVSGSGFNDTITGDNGSNNISGNAGNDIINGAGGNDYLNGGDGNDIINGGSGNDQIMDFWGNDTFVFEANFGKDRISGFQAGAGIGDVIDFAPGLFQNFQALLHAATQVGADTVITLDANNTITLVNVKLSSLNADDFHF